MKMSSPDYTVLYTNYILDEIKKQQSQGTKIAIETTSGKTITWLELQKKIDNLAYNLIQNNFKPGHKVLFLVKPSIEAIVVLHGVVRAGGVLITADLAMGAENFESRVKLANPDWVFGESTLLILQKNGFLRKLSKHYGLEIPLIQETLNNSKIVSVGNGFGFVQSDYTLEDLLKNPISYTPIIEKWLTTEDVQITFTSGTTTKPKGVVHTHDSFGSTIKITTQALKANPNDIFYTNQYYIALPALVSGSKLILNTIAKFNPSRYLKHLEKYKVTKVFDIPRNYQQLVLYVGEKKLKFPKHVDTIMLGSAPVLKGFLQKLSLIISDSTLVWCVYGMTEILPVSLIEMREKLEYSDDGDILGKCLPGVTAKLAIDGELVLRGTNLCNRFLGEPPLKETCSGDICKIDDEDRIILLSRKKDMIIRSNYNIYPTLFEATISQIEGVIACAMVGIYHPDKQDEEIVLAVMTSTDMMNKNFENFLIRELSDGKNSIDQYAMPDRIVFFETFPVSGRSQKIDKKMLKDLISNYER
jgi:acyl-coenzyme A synthetase/AMP-(fatty) acid ligase